MKLTKSILASVALSWAAVLTAEEKTPWTHLNYLNDPDEFQFAIVTDRQGADRGGKEYRQGFEKAIRAVNLLRPEFVMSVGDLIPYGWYGEKSVRGQYAEMKDALKRFVPPFFWVVGNHDIAPSRKLANNDLSQANETSTRIWKEFNGERTYYSFVYKGVLFVALNTIDDVRIGTSHRDMTDAQYAWFKKQLDDHPDVRWTLVFMHQPDVWTTKRWLDFELANLVKRKYTVFSGDWHQYLHVRRHGHDYYVLAVCGGAGALAGSDMSTRDVLLGPKYGEVEHITWVTMTRDRGPVIANIAVDAVLPHDFVNQNTTLSTADENLRFTLDYPPDPKTRERLLKIKAETDLKAVFRERKADLERMRKWEDVPGK